MTQRKLWVMLFAVSTMVTLIGLGFSVYNSIMSLITPL